MRESPFTSPLCASLVLLSAALTCLSAEPARAASSSSEIAPLEVQQPEGVSRAPSGMFSPRTIRVAIEADRDGARLIAYTIKEFPFIRPFESRTPAAGSQARIQVALLGPDGKRYARAFPTALCLEHGPETAPHVMGDQAQLHRDTFAVELPEIPGFDRIEITSFAADGAQKMQVTEALDEPRFTSAGGKARYRDLAFARASAGPAAEAAPASVDHGVIWPEDIGDPELYRIDGVESEGTRRVNVVVVPDAYRTSDKFKMIADFHRVSYQAISPVLEHAGLVNYVLVFAYSIDNEPDQCDCGIVRDTAMGTGFGDLHPPFDGCGGHACLIYNPDGGCDQSRTRNIAEAELRAPVFDHSMGDTTLVLVQSWRPGGCGVPGLRTVTSGSGPYTWHEMGHGWASLMDEYITFPGCANHTTELNTSSNPDVGAWPEWIGDLGPPLEGADHFALCLYKPTGTCLMQSSQGVPLCPVCTQRWALLFYESPRVSPTAPIESMSPASAVSTQTGLWTPFGVTTRLPSGPTITNDITWQIQGPGTPTPTTVAAGSPAHFRTFDLPGDYVLTVKVIADANLIKPAKYGPNVDVATWNVHVTLGPPPLEVSPPGAAQPLVFSDDSTLVWEDGATNHSATFNLYRGSIPDLLQGSLGACLASNLPTSTASDPTAPGIDEAWFYLVAGKTAGAIGPLGQDSTGNARGSGASCP